ncbi:hypothetical protein Sjap_023783 [Stephania japonica]|uniref:Uncharacterized protein n=1 Tax=Stephania japonica TaxID=461633 RepID=A0AAP0EC87_9MAGN
MIFENHYSFITTIAIGLFKNNRGKKKSHSISPLKPLRSSRWGRKPVSNRGDALTKGKQPNKGQANYTKTTKTKTNRTSQIAHRVRLKHKRPKP